jgi:hypothetical protein
MYAPPLRPVDLELVVGANRHVDGDSAVLDRHLIRAERNAPRQHVRALLEKLLLPIPYSPVLLVDRTHVHSSSAEHELGAPKRDVVPALQERP